VLLLSGLVGFPACMKVCWAYLHVLFTPLSLSPRPEMLLPMGLPENVNVIAWGLSLGNTTFFVRKSFDVNCLFNLS
jgi:hypothetical protein